MWMAGLVSARCLPGWALSSGAVHRRAGGGRPADGLYHYDAKEHQLELRRPGVHHAALADMTIGQEMLREANLVVMISGIFQRTMWKYGQRGYRFVLFEAGHLGQNPLPGGGSAWSDRWPSAGFSTMKSTSSPACRVMSKCSIWSASASQQQET